MGAEASGGGPEGSSAYGRKFRSTAARARDQLHRRPRHRLAARPHDVSDRQYALRRLRTAIGLDDLQRPQSISRGDGGRAALLAASGDLETILGQHLREGRRAGRKPPNERGLGHGRFAVDGLRPLRRVDAARHAVAVDRGGFSGQSDIRGLKQRGPALQQRGIARPDRPQRQLQRSASALEHAASAANNAVRTAAQATITTTGERKRVERLPGVDVRRDDDAASGLHTIRSRQHAARGQSPEPVRRDDNLVQSRAGKVAERRNGRVSARSAGDPSAGGPHWRLCRHCARV